MCVNGKRIGAQIKKAREMLDKTQLQLAKESCVSRDIIAGMETGRYENGPLATHLKKLADVLGKNMDWFFEDD